MTDAADQLKELTDKIDDLTAMVADHEANIQHERRKFEILCDDLVRRDLAMAKEQSELWALVKQKQRTAKRLQRRLDRVEGSLPFRTADKMRGARRRLSRNKSGAPDSGSEPGTK